MKSATNDLIALREKLGPSPLAECAGGVHHLHYLVSHGNGYPLVREYVTKTGYALAGHYVHSRTRAQYFVLRLDGSEIAVVVEEATEMLPGFARLTGLAFEARGLDRVEAVLAAGGLATRRGGSGLSTGVVPGLEIRFMFVEGPGTPWFEQGDFRPGLDVGPLNRLAGTGTERARIGPLDHIAFRIRRDDLLTAAGNLMRFTPYRFTDCYTVGDENAETMVFRHGDRKPAVVVSYGWDETSVVWEYVARYGPRVHHNAFYTEDLPGEVARQRGRGVAFTTPEIVGSAERGILQIFTTPSPHHNEITEYIERFRGFQGFFDPGNVGELMSSTRPYNR